MPIQKKSLISTLKDAKKTSTKRTGTKVASMQAFNAKSLKSLRSVQNKSLKTLKSIS